MGCRWAEFLRGLEPTGHAVQIYSELDDLAGPVAAYLAAGFEAGEPALVLAGRESLARFGERLALLDWNLWELEEQGLLVVADAESMLRSILRDDRVAPIAFEAVVGTLLDQLAERFPKRRTRVFGELVNLLCERGQPEAAIAVEELWNALAKRRPFSLLCGYRLDVFDRSTQDGPLPDVCRLLSRVQAGPDEPRLGRAVDRTGRSSRCSATGKRFGSTR